MIQKCKIYFKKVMVFNLKRGKIQNSEKTACQKVVAMVTSNLTDKDLLHQVVPR